MVDLFAGGVGGAGCAEGDALRVTLYAGGCGGWICLWDVLEVLWVREVMRCVRLYMLEAAEGGLCLLEVMEELEVMHCRRLCMLEAVERDSVCGRC